MNLNFDFIYGVFSGIGLSIFGLVVLEQYEMWQERKRRKDLE